MLKKRQLGAHVSPAYTYSRKGSNHFGSYIPSLKHNFYSTSHLLVPSLLMDYNIDKNQPVFAKTSLLYLNFLKIWEIKK
jgi:hypothetical protein